LLVADEDDRVRLQIQGFKTLNEVRGFLAGRQAVEIKTPQREVAYGFIAETLRRFGYARLGRAEEGWVATARRQRLEAKALGIRMGQTLAKHEVTFQQFNRPGTVRIGRVS
jgi:hypothetical protein